MLKPLGTDFGIPIRSMVSPVSVPKKKPNHLYRALDLISPNSPE